MKQRLGIGRAIIHRPKVLLLDEPASGLDPKARFELRNLLKALREGGTTILISSHILTELEGFCTSIGVMEKGRMLRSGRLEEIVAAESQVRVVRMSWVGDGTAEAALKAAEHVSDVMVRGREAVFRFAGSEEELAALLPALLAAGVRVIGFAEVKQTVEDVYLKLSHHEVM
jgi:ABC-2 type transport system ATP-binding protein